MSLFKIAKKKAVESLRKSRDDAVRSGDYLAVLLYTSQINVVSSWYLSGGKVINLGVDHEKT